MLKVWCNYTNISQEIFNFHLIHAPNLFWRNAQNHQLKAETINAFSTLHKNLPTKVQEPEMFLVREESKRRKTTRKKVEAASKYIGLYHSVYSTPEKTRRREELFIRKQGISSLGVINISLASLLSLLWKSVTRKISCSWRSHDVNHTSSGLLGFCQDHEYSSLCKLLGFLLSWRALIQLCIHRQRLYVTELGWRTEKWSLGFTLKPAVTSHLHNASQWAFWTMPRRPHRAGKL